MTVIATNNLVADGWKRVLTRVAEEAGKRGVHPASVVVLVPYAQLMAQAQKQWAALFPDGFMPRFETTRNWATMLGAEPPSGSGFQLDVACDALTGRSLLEAAGFGAQTDAMLGLMLEMAQQLSALAASVAPGEREAWAETARTHLGLPLSAEALQLEAAAAKVALEWVLATAPATDVLFGEGVRNSVHMLVALEGFHPDPLAKTLLVHWSDAGFAVSLPEAFSGALSEPAQRVALHEALDAEDEAQLAAACVMQHLADGHVPVALAATDRALTRRIVALLVEACVPVKDENGWTLSTTRKAAQIMVTLRAAAWHAASDDVLDWLKHLPPETVPALPQLERWLRGLGVRQWSHARKYEPRNKPEVSALCEQIDAWRGELKGAKTLTQWLLSLRSQLQQTGSWDELTTDPAGAKVLAELRLPEGLEADLELLSGSERRMGLSQFNNWANDVMEAGRFRPDSERDSPVIVLPMPQLLARPFNALVLPGCDEKRMLTAPEPPGSWTRTQREDLGLPTREQSEAAQRAAWAQAMRVPHVDILWRTSDEGGEPLLASPLVLALELDAGGRAGSDARVAREVPVQLLEMPAPSAAVLPVLKLSSSAYSDLRHCPYRFYALRQLRLQEADELDAEVDKRDFGTWLHATLQHFHVALVERPTDDADERCALMDESAARATRELHLDEGDFLPFSAGWPALRDGYLRWLTRHEQEGASFKVAEHDATQPLGHLTLVGKLDRIDVTRPGGSGEPVRLVIDYKTENEQVTRKRIVAGSEDIQLAFYAALLQDDVLRAAYVNVGERGETRTFEQEDVVHLRDELVAGILSDMARIDDGAQMPALGEGAVCGYCAARGLCRKDFWA
ncbi:PD-(D/E)XK nuclease family protein [Diaphorobacter sp. HDW4A]|uniref:PD-(D/E)XK nuclease family protein n=1 Tax=Diaphorobacter sp. HDW4A TaxID=2714924 RepID=UPI00140BAC7F|nr:PD-(D/E)XK nuclease family protein [Diaphorobacter sp. HDW4A]QIL79739.1 PD-(D/E)XK nuclease family protein [Diaphorobacter sp. HDW4A]